MSDRRKKRTVTRRELSLLWVAAVASLVLALWWLGSGHEYRLFQTSGQIADQQRGLIVFTMLLSLVVLVPTYVMLYVFAWRYREGHRREYKPSWNSNILIESIWWAIPIVIIGVLAIVTFVTSHSLDPFKPLSSTKKPVHIQVVALNWKWLFIYPEEKVASVNEFALPVNTPMELTLTSDGPMGSFWLPELAGQIYVMAGMSTKLHIDAHRPGVYEGVNANITGKGYSDMRFTARAMAQDDYKAWLTAAANSGKTLDAQEIAKLRKSSVANQVALYEVEVPNAYDAIVNEYMGHAHTQPMSQDESTDTTMTSGDEMTNMNHRHMEGM